MFLNIGKQPGVPSFDRWNSDGGVEFVVRRWIEEVDSCGGGVRVWTVDEVKGVGWGEEFAKGC
jgi:hypothetical protein